MEFQANLDKNDKESAKRSTEIGQKIQDLQGQKLKLRNLLTTLQKSEMLEAIFQMLLSTCLLTMNIWRISLTKNELQGFFNEDSFKFLVLTIPLLIKKVITSTMGVLSSEKNGFAPMVGLLIYSTYGLLSIFTRMTSIVTYFSVPLGLFYSLNHWVYENMNSRHGLTWREYDQEHNPVKFSRLSFEKDGYDVLHIADIAPKLLTNDPYTKYTGLRLGYYFGLFIVGTLVHLLIALLLDAFVTRKCNQPQSSKVSTLAEESKIRGIENGPAATEQNVKSNHGFFMFLRALMSLVIPQSFGDWDEEGEEFIEATSKNEILKVYIYRYNKSVVGEG
jgi:hypothetical protein